MEKEDFEKLSQDQKFPIISFYLNMVKEAIGTRLGIVPTTTGILATFLVIATFNEKILPLDSTVRILICTLVLLIPLTLWLYNHQLKSWEIASRKSIDQLLGKTNVESTKWEKVMGYLPDIVLFILSIIALIIIYKIGCFWSVCGKV
ncbi:hypothetical protein A2641_00780 [Candidatus Nomurabacteria bacterium RIFCSPHIGHO2_01_FULL_37_25]|uniref:Uncharacterized protein n=1 Tax=Candidatus Nomurabacteria bacterium RIFCSPLOWO2_01_FULL_36_16 TaxID=1801767 RepID=A0A1F6WY37_9BACT|nr:MAG: hypothetical protein A2641_00780 [Candidatus Nomurabacteria bacterium RIFCSPHIGHO2_01_FULL_37_25]OGI74931.1 MAG: hypothetical protein A3D36_01385 [Candidatus Nomurabacteria bacterium RIFCSPHIGHO2_02_FULL_36_29]OGI86645.1 MAG: hypothetical protein A3A91_02950 [Candidatus Nomurabacteria bacterium RIFCSPLOWO2_01_FULL_36_16]OGI94709.1 MAG: hypothetical protein A3I84_00210 [Candidatus Nomurabacteria bacterium RIFCSPLOWO2_02_FULL_36_8]